MALADQPYVNWRGALEVSVCNLMDQPQTERGSHETDHTKERMVRGFCHPEMMGRY